MNSTDDCDYAEWEGCRSRKWEKGRDDFDSEVIIIVHYVKHLANSGHVRYTHTHTQKQHTYQDTIHWSKKVIKDLLKSFTLPFIRIPWL